VLAVTRIPIFKTMATGEEYSSLARNSEEKGQP
jgi:hypothetical protein